jgi:hypothetical protein
VAGDLGGTTVVPDLTVNLVAAAIAAGAGWAWVPVKRRIRTRRARGFWRMYRGRVGPSIVIGRHDTFKDFEPSGFVGGGDAMALRELQRIFDEIGIGSPDIIHSNAIDANLLKQSNLIGLGGPDGNWLTRIVLERIVTTIRLGRPEIHEIAIEDTVENEVYTPWFRPSWDEGVDYGAMYRIPSSLFGKEVLLIAGAFGYGTWAGVRLLAGKEFLRHPAVAGNRPFECLYRVDVVGRDPARVEILTVRELPVSPTPT